MDIDTINKDLNRKFAEPLLEFYKRRLVFWYDEDREFEDAINDIVLDNAKVIALDGSNAFAVKKTICYDDTDSNYLIYCPISFNRPDDNWLLNVQLYSDEFRADLNSIWMDEMNLPATPVIRKQIKAYNKFFKAKDRREAFAKVCSNVTTAPQMHLAVMATICGNKNIEPGEIIKSALYSGLDNDSNEIYKGLKYYGADNAFWMMVAQATGYSEVDNPSLGRLAIHMLLTAATRTLHQDNLSGLDQFISIPHQGHCYEFISEWIHGNNSKAIYDVAKYVEREARLAERFDKLQIDDLLNTECFPCINECILQKLMSEIANNVIDPKTIRSIVEKRRTMAWFEELSCYYDGLLHLANMQDFYIEHATGFHTVEPYKIWKEYTDDYYRMDTYYRLFNISFQQGLVLSNPRLDDLFKQVGDVVEGLYTTWFLGSLCQNWSDSSSENYHNYGKILEVPQQNDFYNEYVRKSDSRVFVIISDAFRFEVAVTLAEELRRETQSKVNLNSCAAVFPTATKYGMAALLPHKKITTTVKSNGLINVLADGVPTDAGYRDKILKAENANSVALKYKDIIGMKRAERQDLVKGMDVVYIYHDKIDEASHTSDSAVFPACIEAIDEIKNMVRIIVNEFGGTKVFITADHGFLYTYRSLAEDGKIDKTTATEHDVEVDRRYILTDGGEAPEYMMHVEMREDFNIPYQAYAPRETVRIKKKGGGLNFVHGGLSLQELVVPVVEYQHLRTASAAYKKNKDKIDTKPVSLNLLTPSRKISNMIFSLSLYQAEAVGGNRKAATYKLYFTDVNGTPISDTCKIIADKTNENAQDRAFRCNFNLKNQKYSSYDTYYLVIEDESEFAIPQKEEFQIDIPFAIDEFDFFS